MKLLLASKSPRRKELLSSLGYSFQLVSVDCDEVYSSSISVDKVSLYLSELKADSFRQLENDEVLLTADTVVVLDEKALGKPKNEEEAKQMLKMLSGREHQVFTGITIKTRTEKITKGDCARVYFDSISDEEIDFYLEKYAPYDKAGAYGIQDWIGMTKVRKIDGSFYTIMGLPTHLVYEMIEAVSAKK